MAPASPQTDMPRLQYYGCPMITDLSYGIFFIGKVWSTPYLTQQRANLEAALQAALQEPDLNVLFEEYLAPGQSGPVTASPAAQRGIVSVDWQPKLSRDDLQDIAQHLMDDERLPNPLPANFALAFVLPPGTVMVDPLDPVHTSTSGLASFHGGFPLNVGGTQVPVPFCAAVWSDGSNGWAVPAFNEKPAWLPWENTCAALYHELSELRTNQNADRAPSDGSEPPPGQLGWTVYYGDKWLELPDLPVLWANELPQKVFCKGSINGMNGVPIQALWSQRQQNVYVPPGFMPQMPSGFGFKQP